jgi:hypothetical protein
MMCRPLRAARCIQLWGELWESSRVGCARDEDSAAVDFGGLQGLSYRAISVLQLFSIEPTRYHW